jgi:hypothetical protein
VIWFSWLLVDTSETSSSMGLFLWDFSGIFGDRANSFAAF